MWSLTATKDRAAAVKNDESISEEAQFLWVKRVLREIESLVAAAAEKEAADITKKIPGLLAKKGLSEDSKAKGRASALC